MENTILSVQNLQIKNSKNNEILIDDVSLSLEKGEILGLIGQSGSGKTILARSLINWVNLPLKITSGKIDYAGTNILKLNKIQLSSIVGREISFIGNNPVGSFDPTLPVGVQILEKLLAVKPEISKKEGKEIILKTFDSVKFPSKRKIFDEFPFQFSGGMMQRAIIVDSLISNPKIMIADNITQSLDVTIAAQILRLLNELQLKFDTSIIFISSLLGTVSKIANNIAIMDKGKIIENRLTYDLLKSPKENYTVNLLSEVPKVWQEKPNLIKMNLESDTILEVNNISKIYKVSERKFFSFKNIQAVKEVSFNIKRFENFGIIGESGCGKSTLSRLLSNLEDPDDGWIKFNNKKISGLKNKEILDTRKKFQLLLQDPYGCIPNHKSIFNIVSEPLIIHGEKNKNIINQKVKKVIQEVGLNFDIISSLPSGLSAGQRQRVNIARALILEPELLILDETLSSLDQVEQAKLLKLFQDLQNRYEITYVFISHDLTMVRKVCNRIAVMYLGRIVELAENDTLYNNCEHPYTRTLLSSIPTLDNNPYDSEKYLLEGEPPDPSDVPKGCSFSSRCPFPTDDCKNGNCDMGLIEVSEGHWVDKCCVNCG